MSTQPKKTKSSFNATTMQRALQQRANLLPNITPELLASWHASFRRGYLRAAAIAWEQILSSDDTLVSVAPKREKSVSRHGFEVITVDDSDRAKAHAKTLEEFYNNLTATNAVDLNERGGFKMLVRQMMKSVGFKYAVHEIVWRPGQVFTAEFRFVPLWFFENTSGKLRFLPTASGIEGLDMPDGEWMVTTGDGIMNASAACYLFKHLPLQDGLIYSEKYGEPLIWGESSDTFESTGWNAMCRALDGIAGGEQVVVSAGSKINVAEFKGGGELPYQWMIDLMSRAMATMWRGGDLSTMAMGDGVGAEMQDDEKDTLENDDAANITDVLNEQVDKHVIRYVHGDMVPLAWVRVKQNVRQDINIDIEIDKGLREAGYEEPIEEVQKRYNRPHLRKKETLETENLNLEEQVAAENVLQNLPWWKRLFAGANEKTKAEQAEETFLRNARNALAEALENDLQPVVDRLVEILDDETLTGDSLFQALEKFQTDELPELAQAALADPAAADAIADTLSAGLLTGIGDAVEGRKVESPTS